MRPVRPVDSAKIARLIARGKRLSVIGIDDSPFRRDRLGNVLVCGVVCRETSFEGLLTTQIRRDGWNATARLAEMIRASKFWPQLHVVLLDGVALGGLNVVDLQALEVATGRPCLTVMRRAPNLELFRVAIGRLSQPGRRQAMVDRAGPIHRGDAMFFQSCGLPPDLARKVLKRLTSAGNVPEALRLAHLIGGALVTGQSGRRA
jgi:uncharacterized protein